MHGFGAKLAIFACFYIRQYRPGKCVSRYSRMVLVQNWPFLHVFILRNIGQETVFYDIVKRKNTFLACKNNKLRKVKKLRFFQRG